MQLNDFFVNRPTSAALTSADLFALQDSLQSQCKSASPTLEVTAPISIKPQILSILSLFDQILDHSSQEDSSHVYFTLLLSSFRFAAQLYWLLTLASSQLSLDLQVDFPPEAHGFRQGGTPQQMAFGFGPGVSQGATHGAAHSQASAARTTAKLTARYFIQAQSHAGFDLPRKIIGVGGKNMKSILKAVEHIDNGKDSLKLRLRGKGSNYLEGPLKKECDEPLHLCVSAKNCKVLAEACKAVESLLVTVGKTYSEFSKKEGICFDGSFFHKRN